MAYGSDSDPDATERRQGAHADDVTPEEHPSPQGRGRGGRDQGRNRGRGRHGQRGRHPQQGMHAQCTNCCNVDVRRPFGDHRISTSHQGVRKWSNLFAYRSLSSGFISFTKPVFRPSRTTPWPLAGNLNIAGFAVIVNIRIFAAWTLASSR